MATLTGIVMLVSRSVPYCEKNGTWNVSNQIGRGDLPGRSPSLTIKITRFALADLHVWSAQGASCVLRSHTVSPSNENCQHSNFNRWMCHLGMVGMRPVGQFLVHGWRWYSQMDNIRSRTVWGVRGSNFPRLYDPRGMILFLVSMTPCNWFPALLLNFPHFPRGLFVYNTITIASQDVSEWRSRPVLIKVLTPPLFVSSQ